MLALGRASPITTWLRALARAEHERCGGPGCGCRRDVPDRRVRPGHDGRRRRGRPGAQPAVAARSRHGPAPRGPSGSATPTPGRVAERAAAGCLRARPPLHRGHDGAPRAFRGAARAARRRLRRRRARLLARQPLRTPQGGPLRADRGPRRPSRHSHPRRRSTRSSTCSAPAWSGEGGRRPGRQAVARISPCRTANQPSAEAAHRRHPAPKASRSARSARPWSRSWAPRNDPGAANRSAHRPPHHARSSGVAKHHTEADGDDLARSRRRGRRPSRRRPASQFARLTPGQLAVGGDGPVDVGLGGGQNVNVG